MMLKRTAVVFITLLFGPALQKSQSNIAAVLQPVSSPLVTFRILVMTGSAFDPPGKEGLAALTAAMLTQGGSGAMTSSQIAAALYPTSASFGAQVDKEMTVLSGTAHQETLAIYYSILKDLLLNPGFRADDFKRVRESTLNFLKTTLRESDDEELGKERLIGNIFDGHPYAHHSRGTVSSVERLTIQDVQEFYRKNYTQANLVIGLAGGYPSGFPQQLQADFSKWPAGSRDAKRFAAPRLSAGMRIEIIQRETDATAISLGFPIDVVRGGKDWPALTVAAAFLGQHRSSNGHLYHELREVRGLNYGDYAYIEYFPQGGAQLTPPPNVARQQQVFQIWIRPVEPQNGLFALRAALYEYDRFIRDGLTAEQFEETRSFLTKYSSVLTQTQSSLLGYALDSRYYGMADYGIYMKTELAKLTVDEVNRAIRRHLKSDELRVVIVTKNADALREGIAGDAAAPIVYNSPKPKVVLDEDKVIQAYKVNVKPSDIVITPVAKVFQ
jgi:zinc protease